MQATHRSGSHPPVNAPFILIAETQRETIDQLRTQAAERGLRTEVVTSGEQAMEVLRRITPIGAILSADLSALNGIDICARMKRVSRFKHVPVIVTTGIHNTRTYDASKPVKAEALIFKPMERGIVGRALDRIAFGTVPGSWPNPRATQELNPRLTLIR